jgi:hypothetical protein
MAAASPPPAAASPAAAPPASSTDTYPTSPGIVGVSFFLPSGSDPRLIGASYFLANDVAVRADFGLFAPLTPSGPGQNTLFTVGAAVRFYQIKRERVGVVLGPTILAGRETSPAVSGEAAAFLRFGGAIGVEYFFTNRFSVGATLELTLKLANIAGPASTSVYTTLSTDTSGLSANIFF